MTNTNEPNHNSTPAVVAEKNDKINKWTAIVAGSAILIFLLGILAGVGISYASSGLDAVDESRQTNQQQNGGPNQQGNGPERDEEGDRDSDTVRPANPEDETVAPSDDATSDVELPTEG